MNIDIKDIVAKGSRLALRAWDVINTWFQANDRIERFQIAIWLVLFVGCIVTRVCGFWKYFTGTMEFEVAVYVIFGSILSGGLLWFFQE